MLKLFTFAGHDSIAQESEFTALYRPINRSMTAQVTFEPENKAHSEIDGCYHYELNLNDGSVIRVDVSLNR